jgi:hypothetical protein
MEIKNYPVCLLSMRHNGNAEYSPDTNPVDLNKNSSYRSYRDMKTGWM